MMHSAISRTGLKLQVHAITPHCKSQVTTDKHHWRMVPYTISNMLYICV